MAAELEEIKSGSQRAGKIPLETQEELLNENSECKLRVAQLESKCATLNI